MNRLTKERQAGVLRCLVEGNSLRSTVRMTGVAMNTILKLLADIGVACSQHHDKVMRNLSCKRIDKNVPTDKQGQFGFGSVWTWVALCADTKIVPSWFVGGRDAGTAFVFMQDLASRLRNRVQLTTDGHRAYLSAVEAAFGADIDYAMLVKMYGSDNGEPETRYSPAECIGCQTAAISGMSNPRHVSTSFVERQNLTMRMSMRRFTRLTNGFSKKIENLQHSITLHYTWYNFIRIHKTLRVTPAMEAGIADHVWSFGELVALLDVKETNAA